MKVRAKFVSENGKEGRVVGYYEHRRIREGQVFELKPFKNWKGETISVEKQFSDRWMEKLESETEVKKSVPTPPIITNQPIVVNDGASGSEEPVI